MGHAGAYTRRRFKPRKTRADEARPANLLDRGFDGYVPHARPAGDLTSVRVGGGWAYVCLLAGLADRGIAGHSAGRPRDAGLVLAAFAALDFPLTDVQVFHADRGSGFDNTRIDEPLEWNLESSGRSPAACAKALGETTTCLFARIPEYKHRRSIRANNMIEQPAGRSGIPRVVCSFSDGNSTLILICARIRYVTANEWSACRYLDMSRLDDSFVEAS